MLEVGRLALSRSGPRLDPSRAFLTYPSFEDDPAWPPVLELFVFSSAFKRRPERSVLTLSEEFTLLSILFIFSRLVLGYLSLCRCYFQSCGDL